MRPGRAPIFCVHCIALILVPSRSIVFLPVEYRVLERDSDVDRDYETYACMRRVRTRTIRTHFERREDADAVTTHRIVLSLVL